MLIDVLSRGVSRLAWHGNSGRSESGAAAPIRDVAKFIGIAQF
jgi:hypothetical protein